MEIMKTASKESGVYGYYEQVMSEGSNNSKF